MDPEKKLFIKTLKQNRRFATKQRLWLFEVLQQHSSLSVSQLIERLDNQDQATVYRNIKLFEELGIISRLILGWKSRLELTDRFHHHHHHLSCLNCGKVIILKENAELEQSIAKLSRIKGFKATDHQLEIRGLCTTCQP